MHKRCPMLRAMRKLRAKQNCVRAPCYLPRLLEVICAEIRHQAEPAIDVTRNRCCSSVKVEAFLDCRICSEVNERITRKDIYRGIRFTAGSATCSLGHGNGRRQIIVGTGGGVWGGGLRRGRVNRRLG